MSIAIRKPFFSKSTFIIAMVISIAIHTIVFSIHFKKVHFDPSPEMPKLEIVLVNSKSESKPVEAKALAQNNLDGGGNTPKDVRATSALPVIPKPSPVVSVPTPPQPSKSAPSQPKKIIATPKESNYQVAMPNIDTPKTSQIQQVENKPIDIEKIMETARQIEQLKSRIDENTNLLEKWPKRTQVTSSTREYRFAQYLEDWRIKVERFGNLNYPHQLKSNQIYGNVIISVEIDKNGKIYNNLIRVERSSGDKFLDEAAKKIVKGASQFGFSPLPPNITKDTDILVITRTFSFQRNNRLTSQ